MSKRRLAREYALQSLYYTDTGKFSKDDATMYVNGFYDNLDEDTFSFCKDLVQGTINNMRQIDEILSARENSGKFINGLLDQIKTERNGH